MTPLSTFPIITLTLIRKWRPHFCLHIIIWCCSRVRAIYRGEILCWCAAEWKQNLGTTELSAWLAQSHFCRSFWLSTRIGERNIMYTRTISQRLIWMEMERDFHAHAAAADERLVESLYDDATKDIIVCCFLSPITRIVFYIVIVVDEKPYNNFFIVWNCAWETLTLDWMTRVNCCCRQHKLDRDFLARPSHSLWSNSIYFGFDSSRLIHFRNQRFLRNSDPYDFTSRFTKLIDRCKSTKFPATIFTSVQK